MFIYDRHLLTVYVLLDPLYLLYVNRQNVDGETHLQYAAKNTCSELYRQVVQAGANPSLSDNFGNLPIDYANSEESNNCFKALVDYYKQ